MNITKQIESAYVRCRTYKPSNFGVVEAVYGGPANADVFDRLREWVILTTQGAPAVVIRIDAMLEMRATPAEVSQELYSGVQVAAGAVVVRADQYEQWAIYARDLAKIGVIRAVFLQEYAHLAYEFAERHARLHPAPSPSGFAAI